jgi:hypothetical protein
MRDPGWMSLCCCRGIELRLRFLGVYPCGSWVPLQLLAPESLRELLGPLVCWRSQIHLFQVKGLNEAHTRRDQDKCNRLWCYLSSSIPCQNVSKAEGGSHISSITLRHTDYRRLWSTIRHYVFISLSAHPSSCLVQSLTLTSTWPWYQT